MPQVGEGHPIFAAFWSRVHGRLDRFRPGVVGPARGHVLEVGAGGGENLRFYDFSNRVQRLTLTEPDPHMMKRAERKLVGAHLPVQIIPAAAESLPFPSASFDTVVATLVFCSVEDQAAALAEVRRVLKPGGNFLFMEHVRSADPVWSRLQDFATPVNRLLGAGCHLNRQTLDAIAKAGFDLPNLHRLMPNFPLFGGTGQPIRYGRIG